MLGLDNPIHLAFLLLLLLLVFGAKRLPEMGRSLGAGMRGFKDSITGEGQPTLSAAAAETETVPDTASPPSASSNLVPSVSPDATRAPGA